MNEGTFGELIRLALAGTGLEETLHCIHSGTRILYKGMHEVTLQDLVIRYPRTLPIGLLMQATTVFGPV